MQLNVMQKFESYPADIAIVLNSIRKLIFSVARQEGIDDLVESLKWGEPSYTSSIGSVIRFDWKAKNPTQFCIYFNCNTVLVETFREIYGDTFNYAGNRAIVFEMGQDIPIKELTHCLAMSLRYKKIRHLDLLGA